MKQRTSITRQTGLIALLWGLCLLAGCSTFTGSGDRHVTTVDEGLLQVVVQPGDTLSSLAGRHMGDAGRAWEIARFNDVGKSSPGQRLMLPLSPVWRGGLDFNGYQTVPVLAYHGFSHKRRGNLYVTAKAFEEQMRYLQEHRYHTIRAEELFDFLEGRKPLPDKSLLITLDAGRRSITEIAVPILEKYGHTATIFVYSDFIGGKDALSWKQVKTLAQKGYSIGSQSLTHRNLAKRRDSETFREYVTALKREISLSRDRIQKKTGTRCDFLAYPYGIANEVVIAMLKQQKYRGAFTATAGSNPFFTDPFRIRRTFIHASDNIERFKKRITVHHRQDLK